MKYILSLIVAVILAGCVKEPIVGSKAIIQPYIDPNDITIITSAMTWARVSAGTNANLIISDLTVLSNAYLPSPFILSGNMDMGGYSITNVRDIYMSSNTLYYGGSPINEAWNRDIAIATNTVITDVGVIPSINDISYKTIYEYLQVEASPGIIKGGEFAHFTNDTCVISNGFGLIRTCSPEDDYAYTTSGVKTVKWFSWTNTTFNLLIKTGVYFYMNYSAVQPFITMQEANTKSTAYKWQMFRAYLEDPGGQPYHIRTYLEIKNPMFHDNERLKEVRKIQYGSGLSVSFVSNYFIGGQGSVYFGQNKRNIPESDTRVAGVDFDIYYYDGSEWEEYQTNQIDNINYNDMSSGLVASTNGSYLTYWVYWNSSDRGSILYGEDQYPTLADARQALKPAELPEHFVDFCLLICQVITTNGSESPIEVRYASDVTFASASAAAANAHGNLIDLSLDQHPAYLPLSGVRAMTADLDAGGHKVVGVAEPDDPTDAATMNYVDSIVAAVGGNGSNSPLDRVTLFDIPINMNIVALESSDDLFIRSASGGIMTLAPESLTLNNAEIVGLLPPQLSNSAATRGYVDAATNAVPSFAYANSMTNSAATFGYIQNTTNLVLTAAKNYANVLTQGLVNASVTNDAATFGYVQNTTNLVLVAAKNYADVNTQGLVNANVTNSAATFGYVQNATNLVLVSAKNYANVLTQGLVDASVTNSAVNLLQAHSMTNSAATFAYVQNTTNLVLAAAQTRIDAATNQLNMSLTNAVFAELYRTNIAASTALTQNNWVILTNWYLGHTSSSCVATKSNIVVNSSGVAFITANLSFTPNQNGKLYELGVFINDALITHSWAQAEGSSGFVTPIMCQCIETINSGDKVDVRFRSITLSPGAPTISFGNFNITKLN